MNKHLVRIVPVAVAVLALSSMKLSAFGDFVTADSISGNQASVFEETFSKSKQIMYLTQDTDVLKEASSVSSTVTSQSKGSQVIIIGIEGEMCQVLTADGESGYVTVSKLTDSIDNIFDSADETMYAVEAAEVKKLPSDQSSTVIALEEADEVHVIGRNDSSYCKVEKDGITGYILTDKLIAEYQFDTEASVLSAENYEASEAGVSYTWDGTVLNPYTGVVIGPSGKESYYNLDMSGVIDIMRSMGNTDEYWVREDGVKMLGDYIMVAADLSIRPRGTLVETSLGTAIVCDTGSFIYSNPTQIDVAVAW